MVSIFPIENVIFVCYPYLDEDLAVVLVDNRHDMLILNPTTYWTLANCQMSIVLFKLRHKSENFLRFWWMNFQTVPMPQRKAKSVCFFILINFMKRHFFSASEDLNSGIFISVKWLSLSIVFLLVRILNIIYKILKILNLITIKFHWM